MDIAARVVDPQDVEIEVTITLTAQHWETLCADLEEHWPGTEISRKLRVVLYKLKRDSFSGAE